MSARLIFDKQESGLWTPVTGPSIAPNAPEGYDAVPLFDGIRFYISGKLPYAGVCWKQGNDLRQANAYPASFIATLQLVFSIDDATAQQAEALEFDLMYADQNQNVGNGSGHLNIEKGGVWEIVDANGAWIPTSFDPGIPAANVPTPLTVKAIFDPAKETSQITWVSLGNLGTTVSGPVLPFLKGLGWAANQLVNQIQPGVRQAGGAFSMKVQEMSTAVAW